MIEITNEDNMVLMARYPDKYFDLAIVDPPYGIDKQLRGGRNFGQQYKKKGWDTAPSMDYFKELFRVSKNQIIWGGNYFALGRTRGCIVWDKKNDGRDFSEFEFAWTSFDRVARFFRLRYIGQKESDHPTEKPLKLYRWILHNYAKAGDKILDTHLGSGNSAFACADYGFDLTACEIDTDYYKEFMHRFEIYQSAPRIEFSDDQEDDNEQLQIAI